MISLDGRLNKRVKSAQTLFSSPVRCYRRSCINIIEIVRHRATEPNYQTQTRQPIFITGDIRDAKNNTVPSYLRYVRSSRTRSVAIAPVNGQLVLDLTTESIAYIE
jgi:hypothetical protein